jgi:predicted enzyme related to lactoylglutathione lyase
MRVMDPKNLSRRNFVMVAGIAGLAGATGTAAAANRIVSEGELMPKHPVVHFEIGCRDLAATKDFYQKLFDWPIDESFQIADAGISGHMTALGHDPQHYTMFYVQVEDVAEALAKAVSLGGKKIVGPIPIPTGTFAWFMDPQENVIGLWKPK